MKLVYVAGPFRGKDHWEIEQNIRTAEALALSVWREGAACICPHTNTRHYQGTMPDGTWLAGDLEILRRCDAVMLTHDWTRSDGARAEYAEAVRRKIPTFVTLAALREWLHAGAAPR